ncbi:MAG: FHA domain-containing protein [Hyphomicrobiaceae bacterium]
MSPTAVLVEVLDRHGHVRLQQRLSLDEGRPTFSIGRSLEADIVLDDEHVAPLHAVVELTNDGRLLAGDLGTVNGIVVGTVRHKEKGGLLVTGAPVRIGRTDLRLRTSAEPLAPEKPDRHEHRLHIQSPATLAGLAILLFAAQEIYASWLGAPRDLTTALATSLSLKATVVAGWVAGWALLSRILVGEWRWLRHIAIALGVTVAITCLDAITTIATFAWALPAWRNASIWSSVVALTVVLYMHLRTAAPLSHRRAIVLAAIAPLLAGLGATWFYERIARDDLWRVNSQSRIYPPWLRLTRAVPAEAYFKAAAGLRAEADQRRRALAVEDEDGTASD